MANFTSKVNAGIALLDREQPGWRTKIDLDKLDLASCSVCVLGQIFGDYDEGIEQLNINGYDYGFNAMSGMSELTEAWKEALGKNNTLVEKGDVYKDAYDSAVKVLQTHLVRVDDAIHTAYVVQTGYITNGTFKGDVYSGTPSISVLHKSAFEAGGTYVNKVETLTLRAGMFITSKGKNYFVHSANEVREVKDGAYAVSVSTLDLSDAKEMTTGTGVTFGSSVKKAF